LLKALAFHIDQGDHVRRHFRSQFGITFAFFRLAVDAIKCGFPRRYEEAQRAESNPLPVVNHLDFAMRKTFKKDIG